MYPYFQSPFAVFWGRLDALARKREYRRRRRTYMNEYARRWSARNPDKVRARDKKWHLNHPNFYTDWSRRYRKTETFKKYRRTERWHEIQRKAIKKNSWRRKRDYPTDVFLGRPFKGSVWHHTSPKVVVAIPVSLHRSVFHNLRNGRGMDEINIRAMSFYEAPRILNREG
jgi:hypothetical protein